MDRGQVQDMIAASEARFETRIAEMSGKLDLILDKVTRVEGDNQRTRSTVRTTAIALGGTVLTGMALMVAVANVSFGFGTKAAEVARDQAVQVYNQMEADTVATPTVEQRPPQPALPPPTANSN